MPRRPLPPSLLPGYIRPSRRGTCSRCGKTITLGRNSAPEPVCRPCRRITPAAYRTVRKSYGEPRKCALPGCEVVYTSTRKAQRFCSRLCARKNDVRVLPRACEICGKQFRPEDRHRDGGYVQRTCGRRCGVEFRRRERGTAGREPAIWPSSPIYVRDCACCEKLFTGRRPKAKYCSRRCSNTKRLAVEHQCQCGAVIPCHRRKCDGCLATDKKQRKQRRRRAERARSRNAKREPYTLAEIAARDHYRCGICVAEGRPRQARVAMTKVVPHQKAPTIDHVVPLAKGGDDTRANVQLAHFICNSRKHTGGSQQLAMIG